MTLLTEYVTAVTTRADEYREAEAYYTGDVSETFSSLELKRVLRSTGHRGQQNYCRVVVDAVLNRLAIANVVADKTTVQKKITEIWESNELGLEANEIHRRALQYGDAYAIVWPNEEGEWKVTYNSPLNTVVVYDPENPQKKLYAVKMFDTKLAFDETSKKTKQLNIYTDDAIHKYRSDTDVVSEGTQWKKIGQEDHPFGEVPVFHFRTYRPFGKPEHFEAYGVQNDINKLLATHMYTVDYQGAPQRYALAHVNGSDAVDFQDDETARENVGSLKAEPGSLWFMNGIHSIGQLPAADPKTFWEPIKSLKESMSALTDTPYHYLERGMAGVSSGEALRVSEAPLLKKVADRQVSFGVTWRELFKFILKNEEGLPESHIEVKWDLVESMDALQKWDVMLKKINAGLSHAQALREEGYEESDVQRILLERAQEAQGASFYNRTDADGQQSLQNAPVARVSTDDNAANNENRNGLTEQAKENGGRGE